MGVVVWNTHTHTHTHTHVEDGHGRTSGRLVAWWAGGLAMSYVACVCRVAARLFLTRS
jgi:hypothetical protein